MSKSNPLPDPPAKSAIKAKNWSVANLAYRWELSRETVSRLMANKRRAPYWNDAIAGLPTLSKFEARKLTMERREKIPPQKRSRKSQPWPATRAALYDIASILIATDSIGSVADAGDEGLVISVMQGSTEHFYKIEWPGGTDLFAESEIAPLVADTGRTGIIRDV